MYKKCHQAAIIGEASHMNKKILCVFAKKANFARKIEIWKKRIKITPGHWHSEAVQKTSPSCDYWPGLK